MRPTGEGEGEGYAEFARSIAHFVDTTPGATLPHEMLKYELPAPPADAALRPFRHTAVIFATDPLHRQADLRSRRLALRYVDAPSLPPAVRWL